MDDPRRRGAVFNNECFIETFVEREKKEALSLRNYRGTDAKLHDGSQLILDLALCRAAEWVQQYLERNSTTQPPPSQPNAQGEKEKAKGKTGKSKKNKTKKGEKDDRRLRVILLSESPELKQLATEAGLTSMGCEEYVAKYFAEYKRLQDLCESLSQLLQLTKKEAAARQDDSSRKRSKATSFEEVTFSSSGIYLSKTNILLHFLVSPRR